MQIIVTVFIDKLYKILIEGRHLVELYEQKDPGFIPSFRDWLIKAESLLEENRRPEVSEIAGIRAQLISASHGAFDKTVFYFPAKLSQKKIYRAICGMLFNNAQHVLNNVYKIYSNYRDEAQKLIRQMLMYALQKNVFYPVWNSTTSHSEKLNRLWQSFVNDPDLAQGTRQILSNVNYVDALRIIDEAVSEWKL